MFRKTRTVFSSMENRGDLGSESNTEIENCLMYITGMLLERAHCIICEDSDSPDYALIGELISRLKNSFNVVEDPANLCEMLNAFPENVVLQILDASLCNILENLSVEQVSISEAFGDDKGEVKMKKKKDKLPTLEEIKQSNSSDKIENIAITADVSEYCNRTFFHQIMRARDLIFAFKHYEKIWSDDFSKKWLKNANEKMYYDLAIIFASESLERSTKESHVVKALASVVGAVADELLTHISLGKEMTESDETLKKLRLEVARIVNDEVSIANSSVREVIGAISMKRMSALIVVVDKFIKEKTTEISKLINEAVNAIEIDKSYLLKDNVSTAYEELYCKNLISELALPLFDDGIKMEQVGIKIIRSINSIINTLDGMWFSYYEHAGDTIDWRVAVSAKNLVVKEKYKLGEVVLWPVEGYRVEIEQRYLEINSAWLSMSIRGETPWAEVEGIKAHPQDREFAIVIAKRLITQTLSGLFFLTDQQLAKEVVFAENTLTEKKGKDNCYGKLNASWSIDPEIKARIPFDFRSKVYDKENWGRYYQEILAKDGQLTEKIIKAFRCYSNAMLAVNCNERFSLLLTTLQRLLSDVDDKSEDVWMNRVAYICVGTNIPDEENMVFTYRQARSWLVGDLKLYKAIQTQIVVGIASEFKTENLIDRLSRIVSRCMVTIYSLLEDKNFIKLDDLVLWYAVVNPNESGIRR